ncbi:MAG: TlpA disulfide reductase family protein [Candidatus Pacebacteria bacterium]|nr:TlpA disulfide reductase family protein [Candidatus Paceibacterota bacterium]
MIKPKKLSAASVRQLKKIKSAGSRATSAAAVSGRRLIRPFDHLLQVSRFARVTFISGFVLVCLVLATLVGFHLSRILWSEETARQDHGASGLLPIETNLETAEFAEFKPSGAEAGNLSALRLIDSNNRPFDISALKGRVIVINFWATWCAPCIAELPKLAQMSSVWKNRGVEFIAVSVDEEGWNKVRPFLEQHRVKFLTVMVDRDLTATQSFHIRGLPTTVFFDRQGRDIGRIAGEYDWLNASAMNLLQTLSR